MLYVDGEMHLGDIQERLRGLLAGAGPSINKERAVQNLRFISRQGQGSATWFPSITETKDVMFYASLIRDWGADLVVFDNFSTLGEVDDENSASSFNELTQTLLRLKQLGVATILVHHAGKNGDFRGSSKLSITFEVILNLIPTDPVQEDSDLYHQAAFITAFEKMRSGKLPEEVCASLGTEQSLTGDPKYIWSYESLNISRLQRIKAILEEESVTNHQGLAERLKVSPATISRDMKDAYKRGLWSRQWTTARFKAAKEHQPDEESLEGLLADF